MIELRGLAVVITPYSKAGQKQRARRAPTGALKGSKKGTDLIRWPQPRKVPCAKTDKECDYLQSFIAIWPEKF